HLQDERLSPAQIRQLWAKVPASNVGIFTGPVSGLVGVDVDGPAGEEELARISGGELPVTPEFMTGKGRRLLLPLAAGGGLRTTHRDGRDGRPLSFLAKGSMTVMPPSRHKSGRFYQWLPGRSPDDLDFAPTSSWLLDALRPENGGRRSWSAGDAAAGEDIVEG